MYRVHFVSGTILGTGEEKGYKKMSKIKSLTLRDSQDSEEWTEC